MVWLMQHLSTSREINKIIIIIIVIIIIQFS